MLLLPFHLILNFFMYFVNKRTRARVIYLIFKYLFIIVCFFHLHKIQMVLKFESDRQLFHLKNDLDTSVGFIFLPLELPEGKIYVKFVNLSFSRPSFSSSRCWYSYFQLDWNFKEKLRQKNFLLVQINLPFWN